MSKKEIKFSIKLNVDGKEQLVSATTNVKALKDSISQTKGHIDASTASAQKFQQAFAKWNNIQMAAENLNTAFASFAGAYQKVEVANTRLTTVMQERMNASDQDVAAVQRAIKAQTELGVLGGNVQKAGAQQVATFLTQKDALLTLIPAINDLVAQQKGLNATEQDAQNIGNLFGKAMQGQTTALRRVGISFTEAQEKVLKMGTEQERAAMLAQVVTQNVGHMNQALAQTAAGGMKQFANKLASIKVKIGEWVNHAQKFLSIASSITLLASSAHGAFTAITNLAKAIGIFKAVGAASSFVRLSIVSLRAAASATSITFKALSTGAVTLRGALTGAAVGATTAKMALRGLMISTGIGAALLAISFAAEKLISKFTSSTEAAKNETAALNSNASAIKDNDKARQAVHEVQQDATSRYAEEIGKVQALSATIHNNTLKYSERMSAIKKLQSIIPSYHAQIRADGTIFERNAAAVSKYIQRLQNLAMAEAAFDKLKALYAKRYEQQERLDKATTQSNNIEQQIRNANGGRSSSQVKTELVLNKTIGNAAKPDAVKQNGSINFQYVQQQAKNQNDQRKHNQQNEQLLSAKNSADYIAAGARKAISETDESINAIVGSLSHDAKVNLSTFVSQGGYDRNTTPTLATPSAHHTPHTTHTDKTPNTTTQPEAEEGSIKWLDERINKYKDLAQATGDAEKAQMYLQQASYLEAARHDLALRIGIEKPEPTETKTYIEQLRTQLANAQTQLDNATTIKAHVEAAAKVQQLQQQISEQTNGKLSIPATIQPTYIEQGSAADRRQSYTNAEQRANLIRQDYQIGIIGKDEAEEQIKSINAQLAALHLKPLKLELDTTEARANLQTWTDTSQKAWQSISGGVNSIIQLSNTLKDNGTVWEKASAVINTFFSIMQSVQGAITVINTITALSTALKKKDTATEQQNTAASISNTQAKAGEAIANATASGAKMPFPFNIAAIAASIAAVVAALAMIGNLAFEQGGIVPGTSYSGDKVVARVNSGEMILNRSQQRRLWQMANTRIPTPNTPNTTPTPANIPTPQALGSLQGASQMALDVNVRGRISGRDLQLVMNRRDNLTSRA